MQYSDWIYETCQGNFQTPALPQRCERRLVLLYEPSLSANMSTRSAGVWVTAQGKNIHAFPKDLMVLLQADGSNLRPTLSDVAVLSFFPETNKTCFSILLGLKYLSLFSQGRRGTPEATEGRKSLQGSTEVGHVLQLLIV